MVGQTSMSRWTDEKPSVDVRWTDEKPSIDVRWTDEKPSIDVRWTDEKPPIHARQIGSRLKGENEEPAVRSRRLGVKHPPPSCSEKPPETSVLQPSIKRVIHSLTAVHFLYPHTAGCTPDTHTLYIHLYILRGVLMVYTLPYFMYVSEEILLYTPYPFLSLPPHPPQKADHETHASTHTHCCLHLSSRRFTASVGFGAELG